MSMPLSTPEIERGVGSFGGSFQNKTRIFVIRPLVCTLPFTRRPTPQSGSGPSRGRFGGGTSINWACCLDTPKVVREQWAAVGLTDFLPTEESDFTQALDEVRDRIGASTQGVVHNKSNQMMLDGCSKVRFAVVLL